jgi:two-component system, OmpR family, sensor kinase
MTGSGLLAPHTLRTRLTLLITALLLIGCAAAGVATSLAVRSFLIDRLDQQLALAGSRYATALEHGDNDADNNPETSTVGQPVGTLGARVLNGTVTAIGVVSDTGEPTVVSPADGAKIATLTPSEQNHTIEFSSLGKYRVHVSAGQDGDILITGLPQGPVDETLRHIILTELIVFLLVIGVIGVIGAIAIRRALRPLENVAATARRVSELPLATGDGRLPERVEPADETTEVGQVAAAVNHMLGRVENALTERQRSEERLRQFVADASHDLRTPLAIVRSHAELIQQDSAVLPETVVSSVGRIVSATERMARLVDDLLLLARLDSGVELRSDVVDLSRILIDATTDAGVAAPDHHWVLDLPEHAVELRGDPDRLHQVVANLLSNAGVHTPPGTTVTVGLKPSSPGGVQLSVCDDGPGIPPDLVPRVQQRFVRGDPARSGAQGGSGLGLAIVAAVVAAHHGTMELASEPGRTCVTIQLPTS